MFLHQVVFSKPYNSANRNNLKRHMEIMERVRYDMRTKSIVIKAYQSIQHDKNKKECAFTIGDKVNVQYLKGPFTVEEPRTFFHHAAPEQLKNTGKLVSQGHTKR
eukprot:TRINITY_DN4427_c0_g1_i3.p2 TRINITY_DN4427_c0_g1~~TRINITY_DN4427_c0_g1_i3.p2  ORF type:complete len:105 (+),score=4.55 TRINITY_DN4427_c0_g1_i3:202-516(+)